MNKLYIGFMTGTSLDGIDASLIKSDGQDNIIPMENLYIPYSEDFKNKIKKLFKLEKMLDFFETEKELTDLHIQVTKDLLSQARLKAFDIEAIGFHGQTIYHDASKSITWQIGNACMLATATQIKTIYDFRKKDISYGGQGAPLMPIFHKAIMKEEEKPIAVLNIGGVANITYIDDNTLIAFDTGPGNALIDDACQKYFGRPYDNQGESASQGKVKLEIVKSILAKEYFKKPYPKSLDRNEFCSINQLLDSCKDNDVITTLTYLTAASIADSLEFLPLIPKKIYLCGGGARNFYLINLITELISKKYHNCKILNINQKSSLNPDFIESQGFAYLAARYCNNLSSAFPSTTGASRESICGVMVKP